MSQNNVAQPWRGSLTARLDKLQFTERLASIGIAGDQLRALLKPPVHQNTIVLRGLWGPFIGPPECRETPVSQFFQSDLMAYSWQEMRPESAEKLVRHKFRNIFTYTVNLQYLVVSIMYCQIIEIHWKIESHINAYPGCP